MILPSNNIKHGGFVGKLHILVLKASSKHGPTNIDVGSIATQENPKSIHIF